MEMGIANLHFGRGFSMHHGIRSAVKRVTFITERISHIILRCRWYVTVLNVHAPTEDMRDDTKDSFYEEIDHVFGQFPKYHMINLLGDFKAKVSNQQSEMRVHIKLIMIMGLEQ
jgi:hypothetical protein